eukprot:810499-Amphidinium_carterae.2
MVTCMPCRCSGAPGPLFISALYDAVWPCYPPHLHKYPCQRRDFPVRSTLVELACRCPNGLQCKGCAERRVQ